MNKGYIVTISILIGLAALVGSFFYTSHLFSLLNDRFTQYEVSVATAEQKRIIASPSENTFAPAPDLSLLDGKIESLQRQISKLDFGINEGRNYWDSNMECTGMKKYSPEEVMSLGNNVFQKIRESGKSFIYPWDSQYIGFYSYDHLAAVCEDTTHVVYIFKMIDGTSSFFVASHPIGNIEDIVVSESQGGLMWDIPNTLKKVNNVYTFSTRVNPGNKPLCMVTTRVMSCDEVPAETPDTEIVPIKYKTYQYDPSKGVLTNIP